MSYTKPRLATEVAWISKNLEVVLSAAARAYQTHGRGALILDQSKSGVTDPSARYFREGEIPGNDEDITRMVQEYDPTVECVMVLIQSGGGRTSYRLRSNKPKYVI